MSNPLNDGTNRYTNHAATQLKTLTQGPNTYAFTYDGQGHRIAQTTNSVTTNYTLDLASSFAQVLSDDTHTDLYGNMRLAQETTTTTEYYY